MSNTPPDPRQAGGDDAGFLDYLPVKAERIAPGEYKILAADGHLLFYIEGAALGEWIVKRINGEESR